MNQSTFSPLDKITDLISKLQICETFFLKINCLNTKNLPQFFFFILNAQIT